MSSGTIQPFFRVPPFPGCRPTSFARPATAPNPLTEGDVEEFLEAVGQAKVGGAYWAAQPPLPDAPYRLIRVRDRARRRELIAQSPQQRNLVWLPRREAEPGLVQDMVHTVSGDCDPWSLLRGAKEAIVDADDELAMIVAVAGVPLQCVGNGPFQDLGGRNARQALTQSFHSLYVKPFDYLDPFTGEPAPLHQLVETMAFWRNLIDGNRDIDAALGFAFWKRPTVAPLLWAGSRDLAFTNDVSSVRAGASVAIWPSRAPRGAFDELRAKGAKLIEVEDGFIRSVGLGADCVPPLSIVVDRLGAHFDPAQPSELEMLLEHGEFATEMLARSRRLRDLINASGISKYASGNGAGPARRRVADRKHVLVPGQVEDDRSVLSGGASVRTNLELLRRARACEPEAYILYKPHPDVEAGHRVGAIADSVALSFADEVIRDPGISPLIDMVDGVHVNTSLAGFEALLRGKNVTTHGVPFYAGWGLTTDLGPVPGRRTKQRSLDELIAAVLLLYPRYLDPETGLPCPAEVLIRRLSQPTSPPKAGPVVRLRRLQGTLKRRMGALRFW